MAGLAQLGEVHTADVIILGGGLAGLIVANKVKELNGNLDVLVVEKATTGFSGSKANKGAGVVWVMQEDDDIDRFRDYYVKEIGHGLEDQELLEKVCVRSLDLIAHLERWGIQIMRDEQGKLIKLPELPYWSLCAYDLDILDKLRRQALKYGVRMIDKTQSVELLTEGERVVGAVGFGLLDGTFRIFQGKAVVLANGSCNWMVTNMWYSGRGDGIAAAWRAGAEMRNGEFSNFYNLGLRGNMSCVVGGQYALYNDDGEYLAAKYCKDGEPDIDIGILLGMEQEVRDGKGPIRLEETELFCQNPLGASALIFRWNRPLAVKFWKKLFEKESRFMADHDWRPEVVPQFIGECAPVKTDHEMRTNLSGLWALGDTNRAGTCWNGATPPPGRLRGTGLGWAGVSALLGASSLAEYATQAPTARIDEAQIKKFKADLYAPLRREKGVNPRAAIWQLKEVISPPRYSIRKSEERILEALDKVKEVLHLAETAVSAEGDWHMLGLCHDLKNMAQCALIYYTSALTRTESRGWHWREDYPARDDANWRRWVVVKKKGDGVEVTTEKIPWERYKTQI